MIMSSHPCPLVMTFVSPFSVFERRLSGGDWPGFTLNQKEDYSLITRHASPESLLSLQSSSSSHLSNLSRTSFISWFSDRNPNPGFRNQQNERMILHPSRDERGILSTLFAVYSFHFVSPSIVTKSCPRRDQILHPDLVFATRKSIWRILWILEEESERFCRCSVKILLLLED